MHQLAGICGVDPGPLTLRELLWMAEGRGRDAWAHTSSLMALIANATRDPKKGRSFRPDHFNPYVRRRTMGVPITPDNIGLLKAAFVVRGRR